ncbi:hypothetical protein [aff. Roholtiella sp. LEGE 12411]|nr:hypothetical protein [aff. Roholtiella sp. LEGE 12411]
MTLIPEALCASCVSPIEIIMNQELTQAIASEVQLFHSIEQKENFLFLLY